MFQTLVDVNARKYTVWEEILKGEFTHNKADMFWQDTLRRSSEYTKDVKCGRSAFQPMSKTFAACYEKMFYEFGLSIDASHAVSILFKEHGRAEVFQDALDLFRQLDSSYRVWISSDTDRDMILPLLSHFKHERSFLSEEIGAYKQDEQGRFFEHILNDTKVRPEEILHVGDGLADIIGAKRAGIDACWINRENKEWSHNVAPDYTIQSLLELLDIV
jgi:FMN hydrolase / 5-amino-6-(5-phospho-D-ribitylamino)uracil phosphatase